MRCMKSSATWSHFPALRRSPLGNASEQCQTGLPMSGRNRRTAENSRANSCGFWPLMFPPTRSTFLSWVAFVPMSKM